MLDSKMVVMCLFVVPCGAMWYPNFRAAFATLEVWFSRAKSKAPFGWLIIHMSYGGSFKQAG